MSYLWNEINLPAPNGDFCVYDVEEFEVTDISDLVTVLTNVVSEIGNEHPAWDETSIFMALKNRIAHKLPCDKFLQILKMIGHCLRKLVVMRLFERYIDLADNFLRGLRNDTGTTALLPSRQQLEYLLIRTQGAAKLIYKAISYTEETFCHLIQRFKVGHLIQTLVMACSVMGRIRTTYTALLLQICEAYNQLKPWLNKLKEGMWQWPEKLELPEDLWEWIKPKKFETNEVIEVLKKSKENVPFLNSFFCEDKNEQLTPEMLDEVIPIDVDDKSDDSVVSGTYGDIGVVQPRGISESGEERNSSVAASSTETNKVDFDKTSLFLDSVMQVKAVKKMIFILKLACSKKRSGLEKMFKDKFSKDVRRSLKTVLRQLKLDYSNTKSRAPDKELFSEFRKAQRKNLLEKAKADVISIFKTEIPISDIEVVDIVESDIEILEIVCPPKSELTPVRTLPTLHQLFHTIQKRLAHDNKELSVLSHMFKKGVNDVSLLKEHGESELADKLIFRLSKKMINHCKKVKR